MIEQINAITTLQGKNGFHVQPCKFFRVQEICFTPMENNALTMKPEILSHLFRIYSFYRILNIFLLGEFKGSLQRYKTLLNHEWIVLQHYKFKTLYIFMLLSGRLFSIINMILNTLCIIKKKLISIKHKSEPNTLSVFNYFFFIRIC